MLFGALFASTPLLACVGDLEENLPSPQQAGAPADVDASAPSAAPAAPVHFDTDIQHDLDALTCTSASCHGAPQGQGGFRLVASAAGADLAANYDAFKTRANAGENSKVLIKPTGGDGHVGGARFAKSDATYTRWLAWMQQGEPR